MFFRAWKSSMLDLQALMPIKGTLLSLQGWGDLMRELPSRWCPFGFSKVSLWFAVGFP